MVLTNKNKLQILFISFFLLFYEPSCFSQDGAAAESYYYWKDFFNTAFENSTKIKDIQKEYLNSIINKKQYDYKWFPTIFWGIQETLNSTRGDYIYVLNQTPDSERTLISSPLTSISITQTLPGNGTVSLAAGYGFNYSIDRRAFLQWPQVQLNLNQYLNRGAFGITRNPEYHFMQEQTAYYELIYRRNLNQEIQNILLLIQKADNLDAQENYYASLVDEYESELETSIEKNLAGTQSKLQIHYADHQLSQAKNNLNNTRTEKENVLKELFILNPKFNLRELNTQRNKLSRIISDIYYISEPSNEDIESNLQSQIYSSILKQYLFQYQTNEISFAPELFMTSSVTPNNNLNAYYSDWYKSFRIFKENKNSFDYSVTLGVRKNFEIPQARKKRKEIYTLHKEAVEKDFEITQKSQKNEITILKNQLSENLSYIEQLQAEIETERNFRKERQTLYEQNFITKDEFLKSETLFFQIYMDYISTFWKCIINQIDIINLCSSDAILLKKFMED